MSALVVPFVSASANNAHLNFVGAKLCRFLKDVCDLPATYEIAQAENEKRMLVVITDSTPRSIVTVTGAIKKLKDRGVALADIAIAGPDREINCVYGAAPQLN